MRNFNKILFAVSLLFLVTTSSFSQQERGRISGDQNVCLNQYTFVTFSINNDNGDDPYTFTYTINGVTPAQTISTANGSNSVIVPVNTSISSTLTYVLTGVVNNNNQPVQISTYDRNTSRLGNSQGVHELSLYWQSSRRCDKCDNYQVLAETITSN